MIKYFTVENFLSIKNENVLEFDVDIDRNSPYVANPVIGFAGANASGKTTILQAITFALWFMQNSFLQIEEDDKIPIDPFCTLKESPTKFHLIFSKPSLVDQTLKRVDYEYLLSLTQERVLGEELYYYPYGKKRIVYIRNEQIVRFGNTINEIQTRDLRPNSSIVSFATQFESQKVALACKNYEFYSNVRAMGLDEQPFHPGVLEKLLEDENKKRKTLELLQIADIGIEEVSVEEGDKAEFEEILQAIETMSEEQRLEFDISSERLQSLRKAVSSENIVIKRLLFKHNIDNAFVDFEPDSESAGTLRFLVILRRMLDALENGELIILDEIELKLHQNLVGYLIGLFENKAENQKGAQLLFSFHNTAFMEILRPAQLWFAEKNDEGHTELFSAADFKDIKQLYKKNLERLYRIGRFGAKPRSI